MLKIEKITLTSVIDKGGKKRKPKDGGKNKGGSSTISPNNYPAGKSNQLN